MCTPHQTNLLLPRHACERRPDAAPLAAAEILFLIMGSRRYRLRSLRAHRTWCAQPHRLSCLFFSDERKAGNDAAGEAADPSGVPLVEVRAAKPPRSKSCCPPRSKSTFCDAHRAATLPAQYRFLPALQHVKASAAFRQGRFRWLAVVDDDSFVFPTHLRWRALHKSIWPSRHPRQTTHPFSRPVLLWAMASVQASECSQQGRRE